MKIVMHENDGYYPSHEARCVICGQDFQLGRLVLRLDSEDTSCYDRGLGLLCYECVEVDQHQQRYRLRDQAQRLRHHAEMLDDIREDLALEGITGLHGEALQQYRTWREDVTRVEREELEQAIRNREDDEVPF